MCKQANIKPEECIVVGDTSADTGMGRNANAKLVVGVLTGSGTTEQLLRTGAHVVIPNISYLMQYIFTDKPVEHDYENLDDNTMLLKIKA